MGQHELIEGPADRALHQGAHPDRGGSRPGQNQRGQGPGRHGPGRFQADSVHPGPAAGRSDRHGSLSAPRPAISTPRRARSVQQHHPGRRNQPRAVQGSVRPAGSHAGAPGDHRRHHLSSWPIRFWCMATQNPIEQEGTYPLPEAQVDRFMLKLLIDTRTRRKKSRSCSGSDSKRRPRSQPVHRPGPDRRDRRPDQQSIYMDEKLKDYIVDSVFATREPRGIQDRYRRIHSISAPRPGPRSF